MADSLKEIPIGEKGKREKLPPLIVKSPDDSITTESNSLCSVDSENGLYTSSSCSVSDDIEADSGIGESNNTFGIERLQLDHDRSITPTFSTEWISDQIDTNKKHRYSDDATILSPLYRENELQYYKPKRSSSLKSKRTPPDTPNNKMVRFADAFGLDLESVRHVFNQESPPNLPASALKDLHYEVEDDSNAGNKSDNLFYNPHFPQPGAGGNFIHRVKQQNVCLENSVMENMVLTGTVRVRSLGFKKRVVVRITFDGWRSIQDVEATYIPNSHDGLTDRFTFSVLFPDNMSIVGSKAEFAIQYLVVLEGQEFWDNNYGVNYVYECFCTDNET